MFKRNKLTSAMLTVMAGSTAVASTGAFAQGEEELYVTGIRASVERAMDIKRNSSGVVDAISAEDIGKFPDSNLAESLQRITGVSIDRRNGEGFQVTVRGFGPAFNLITLNGRSMPATQLGARGGINSSRSFDMSNIASEGVSGVEVYKTAKAHTPSGGIGATVNLKTLRPFDNEGFKASVGAKAIHDTTAQVGNDYTPEYSGFLSWSNDMLGASISYSHQERESSSAGVFMNNWADYSGTYNDATFFGNGTEVDVANIENAPVGVQANHTPGIRYHYGDYERTRDNMQVALQFRPFEGLTATLDYTEANQTLHVNSAENSYWFGGGAFPVTNAVFDGNNQAATPIYLWAENRSTNGATYDLNNTPDDPDDDVAIDVWAAGAVRAPGETYANGNVRDIGITQNQGAVQNNLESVGFNLEWEATDSLSFTFDAHNSKSESLPADGAMANHFNIAMGIQGVYGQGYINTGDLPLLVGAYSDRYSSIDSNDNGYDDSTEYTTAIDPETGAHTYTPVEQFDDNGNLQWTALTNEDYGIRDGGLAPGFYDVADLGSTVRQINHDRTWSETTEIRLDGSWEFENGKIDFGVQTSELEATQKSSFDQIVLEGNWGVGTPGDIPPHEVREVDFADLFSDYRTTMTDEERAWFDAAGTTDPRTGDTTGASGDIALRGFIVDDLDTVGRLLSRNAGLEWTPNPSDGTNRTIKEDIFAAYIQGQMEFDLGGMPLNVLAGLRYEETEVESNAQVGVASFTWQGDNDFTSSTGAASEAPITVGEATYDHVLPNLDVSLGFTENLIARASYSTTIARADYGQLQEGMTNIGAPSGGPTILRGTFGGNPGNANNGNVALEPVESDNFDLSLEWYFDDASYASIGYFYKSVPNFIGNQPELQTVEGVRDPTNGPRAEAAIAELARLSIPLTQQSLFAMMGSMNLVPSACINNPNAPAGAAVCGGDYGAYPYEETNGWENGIDIRAVDSGQYADPFAENIVSRPVNFQDATIDGFEFAIQHFFGDSGFGIQTNYTLVDGDIGYDITGSPTTTQFALAGLSDSANLVLMYEQGGLSSRVTYNWRDSFLISPTGGGNNEPSHAASYAQLDFNVAYSFTDNFTVALEGINVLEEDGRTFGRTERQLQRLDILGARYALSARYNF